MSCAFLIHVYAYDQASAERFVDALATMRGLAPGEQPQQTPASN